MNTEAKKYRWVCRDCGSEEVSCDATVRWDYDKQEWGVSGVHEGDYCDICEEEIRMEQKFDE